MWTINGFVFGTLSVHLDNELLVSRTCMGNPLYANVMALILSRDTASNQSHIRYHTADRASTSFCGPYSNFETISLFRSMSTITTTTTTTLFPRKSQLYITSTPRSPITVAPPQTSSAISQPPPPASTIFGPPAPPAPLPWLWRCHQCNRSYSLAVTRRCLDDGHTFCAGEHTVTRTVRGRRTKRRCRGRACSSEFDYVGWAAWGQWREAELRLRAAAALAGDGAKVQTSTEALTRQQHCERNCHYPSECRWRSPAQTLSIVGASSLAIELEVAEGDADMDVTEGLVAACEEGYVRAADVEMELGMEAGDHSSVSSMTRDAF